MRFLRSAGRWLAERDNQRDVAGLLGLAALWHGLEQLLPGSGYAVAGAALLAVAVLVR